MQTFPNEMVFLQGNLFGDPDFASLDIVAGSGNGLPPSTGNTTLTDLGNGTFVVDSFFDIDYRIDFVGAPGGALDGMSGSTTGTLHMVAEGQGAGNCIPAGDDCWATQCGGGTLADFSGNPIPAGFFGANSQPYNGVIELGGPSGGLGTDTVMRRLGDLCFDGPPPSTSSVGIQIEQLDLVSCQPITVETDDGPTQWNVQVGLSGPQPPGSMMVTQSSPDGGTFKADFSVQPVYTFTRVGNPSDQRVFDTLTEGISPIQMQSPGNVPWSTDESQDPCPGDGFAPGFSRDGAGGLCCPETCHSSFGTAPHEHCTTPPDCTPCPDGLIPPGQDCWSTPCGATRVDFCETPIPANFFDPGSLPFEGDVQLQGAGNSGGDTLVNRFDAMVVDVPGAVATTQIELASLSLVSCSPITVQGSGDWDVAVSLSQVASPPPGTMTVEKTHDNGGTFESSFFVQPVFTFTRVGNPGDVRVLDTALAGLPPVQLDSVVSHPWSHEVKNPTGPICGVNFVPGVESDPGNLPGCTTTEECCVPVGHAGPGHLHVTGQECGPCTCGACCDPSDGSCTEVVESPPDSAEDVCVNQGGEYKGDGTSCVDTDGDGIADWFETNDCCNPNRDNCNTGTDPNSADTDGDGVNDGDEIANGTDPCVRDVVPAGTDCWTTPCGATQVDFCQNPIPAAFFDPGSLPFEGEVKLQGAGSLGGDTRVARLADMVLPTPGSQAATPIEIVALSLVSCAPITVQGSGDWNVEVSLSATGPPQGQMTVDKTHDNGGTFESSFFVQPVFTFKRVGNPGDVRILDTAVAGLPPVQLDSVVPHPWSHEVKNPTGEICGVNFAPGVESDPANLPGCTTTEECCVPVGHAGPGHLHVTGQECGPCTCGACCDPSDGSCTEVVESPPDSAEDVCVNQGGEYKGDGTSCVDTDGDGIADWFETNDCCNPNRDNCNTGTDPNKADTDGDGVRDGDELAAGTDPCVAESAVPVVTGWGLLLLAVLLAVSATVIVRRSRIPARG